MHEPKLSTPDNDLANFRIGDTQCFLQYFHEHYSYFVHFLNSGYKWDLLTSKRMGITIFLLLWSKRADFDSWRNINAFLYVTCRQESVNYLRHLTSNPGDQYMLDHRTFDQLPDDICRALKSEI